MAAVRWQLPDHQAEGEGVGGNPPATEPRSVIAARTFIHLFLSELSIPGALQVLDETSFGCDPFLTAPTPLPVSFTNDCCVAQ